MSNILQQSLFKKNVLTLLISAVIMLGLATYGIAEETNSKSLTKSEAATAATKSPAKEAAQDKKDHTHSTESAKTEEPTASAEELFKISPNDMVVGDKNAKVTVIEYASLTCSHCADFHKNTYPEIKAKYIDTGKIKFVNRPFPLDEQSLRAAMLATCAGKEKFHKFIDVMFSTQANWAYNKNYLEVLANIGKLGGLTGADFDKCMADKTLEDRIMLEKLNASKVLAVRATPSFFINGQPYKGAHNFEYFSKVLDEALK